MATKTKVVAGVGASIALVATLGAYDVKIVREFNSELKLASSPQITEQDLSRLSTSGFPAVLEEVACKTTQPQILEKLSSSPEANVLECVAKNPKTPITALKRIADEWGNGDKNVAIVKLRSQKDGS